MLSFINTDQLLSEGAEDENKPVVNFVFLTRSGNKQQYNSVEMPVDSELVTKLRTREEVIVLGFSSFVVRWFLYTTLRWN